MKRRSMASASAVRGPVMITDPLMTQAEVAAELGVTAAAVYLIERRAIEKLRRECKKRGLTPENILPELPPGPADQPGCVRHYRPQHTYTPLGGPNEHSL